MTALKKSKEGQGLKKDDLTENIKKVLNIGKDADPDSDPDKLLSETAKLLAEAIEIYVKSGAIQTTVTGTTMVPTPAGTIPVPLTKGSGLSSIK